MTKNYIALFILANRCVFSFFLNTTTDSVFLTSSGKLFHTVSDERVKDLDASTDVSSLGFFGRNFQQVFKIDSIKMIQYKYSCFSIKQKREKERKDGPCYMSTFHRK